MTLHKNISLAVIMFLCLASPLCAQKLIDAAEKGDATTVKRYLSISTADIDVRNKEGQTALIVATRKGRSAIITELINAGADVNVQSDGGYTALMWAADKGHTAIVRELVSVGVDVNAQANSGSTALSLAEREGNVNVANILKAAGAR